MIWKHKKVMLKRIQLSERDLPLSSSISFAYSSYIVSNSNHAHMLYASHHAKRRDELLPTMQALILSIKDEEELLLNELLSQR